MFGFILIVYASLIINIQIWKRKCSKIKGKTQFVGKYMSMANYSKKLGTENFLQFTEKSLASTTKASAKTVQAALIWGPVNMFWSCMNIMPLILKCLLMAWYPAKAQAICCIPSWQGKTRPHLISGSLLTLPHKKDQRANKWGQCR